MIRNTKIVKLDINRNLYDTLTAKQGDTQSRFLLFQLLDGATPFSLENRSVKVFATKPDGKEVFNDLIINDRVKGYCTLELTNQMLAVPGLLKLELMVIEGDKKLTTNVFYMDVKKSINSENAIVSTNEFSALLNGLASLNEYDNYKNEIAAARDGEVNLLTKVKKIDEHLEHNVHNLNERINSFTKLEEGSTTGDAELIDGRIGEDGITYDNIGSAIRGQFKKVNNFTDSFCDMQIPFEKVKDNGFEWKLGRITSNGTVQYGSGTYAGIVSSKIYTDFYVNIIESEFSKYTILVAQYNILDDSFVKIVVNNAYTCGDIKKEEGKYHMVHIGTKGVSLDLETAINKVNLSLEESIEYSIKIKPNSVTENELTEDLVKKINNSTLEIATSEKIGGVRPVEKTGTMTQSVGIDAEGRLFTFPNSGESGIGKVINVCFFGAKGDGVTDDTIAIRNARDESKNTRLPLYFPSGTYLVHGTIQIFSNMIVCGDGANTVIKKIQAVTQNLTQQANKGDTTIHVTDASKFTVGFDVYVGLSDWGSYSDTVGVIKAVDTTLNTITIEAYKRHSATNKGLARAVPINGVISQTFPIFSTLRYDDCGENIFIERLICDGNKITGEPESYQLSPIHIDPLVAGVNKNGLGLTIIDVIVRNSNADGISMQNMGRTSIINCTIEDAVNKGIHPGFTTEGVSIIGCYIYNVKKGEAIFDCYSVGGLMIENCYIVDSEIGIGGLEESSKGTVINNCVIKRCKQGIKPYASTYGSSITGCSFSECNTAIMSYVGGDVAITGCSFYNNGVGVMLQKAFRNTITGNYFKDNKVAIDSNYQPSKPTERGANNIIANNISIATASGKTAKFRIAHQDNSIVTGNILTGNSNVIEIDEASTNNIIEVNNITS